jgi:TRAP-type C4-dicarboxylate transport system substrate-binding protein
MIVYPGALLGEQEATFEQTRNGAIDINRTNIRQLCRQSKYSRFALPSGPPTIATGF